ncbi:hypothetical protein Pmani_002645 [Petrolisthes manimaculis]|uniref:Uncharacterized protein n=1 Tax=Petrolisthes manimaculis TaxID=1843537 RepID=A0AAE1QIA2_9EUCA|nr:hypothetical protein Pmani_002645 [Petrolisthes manimaculis]
MNGEVEVRSEENNTEERRKSNGGHLKKKDDWGSGGCVCILEDQTSRVSATVGQWRGQRMVVHGGAGSAVKRSEERKK